MGGAYFLPPLSLCDFRKQIALMQEACVEQGLLLARACVRACADADGSSLGQASEGPPAGGEDAVGQQLFLGGAIQAFAADQAMALKNRLASTKER